MIDRRKCFLDDDFFWEQQKDLKDKIIFIYTPEYEFGCGNWGLSWTIASEQITINMTVYYQYCHFGTDSPSMYAFKKYFSLLSKEDYETLNKQKRELYFEKQKALNE